MVLQWEQQRRSFHAGGSQPPLLLVLDVDETLWRCVISGVHKKRHLAKIDTHVNIEALSRDGTSHVVGCDISWRPGLTEFLDWIRMRRDEGAIEGPWLFTTGAYSYVHAVLTELDPDGDLFGSRVLAKDACTTTATPSFYLKDLNVVPSTGGVKRTILVDNNPVSCILQPESCILIHDWLGDGVPDNELARVISVLDDAIANGMEGDYAGAIARAAAGHDTFKQNLANLMTIISEKPNLERSLSLMLKERWAEVISVKREFLGPGPGCQ